MTSPPDAATCPAATGPIPQIIHQSWRTHELPSTLRPLSASWTQLSGWRHRLWTDDENRALWAAHFPELLDVYDGYARPVQRADATRLLYMHVHGGVYADLDIQLLSTDRLRQLLSTDKVYLPFEKGRLVGQSIIVSPARHPFLLAIATKMVSQYDSRCYETMNTGPDKLTWLWNDMCHAVDPRSFTPKSASHI